MAIGLSSMMDQTEASLSTTSICMFWVGARWDGPQDNLLTVQPNMLPLLFLSFCYGSMFLSPHMNSQTEVGKGFMTNKCQENTFVSSLLYNIKYWSPCEVK